MNNINIINKLRQDLIRQFKEDINSNEVCLLDLPNYSNSGDQLIWRGEEYVLKKLNKKIIYRASADFFDPTKVPSGVCIILHGGGNFGDLYNKHQKFREYIVNTYPKNKIIIAPSTVYYKNTQNLLDTKKIFSKHPDLTIYARDIASFELLKKYLATNKIKLVTDAAFAIQNLTQKTKTNGKILFICRNDPELGSIGKRSINFIKNLDISDWPVNNTKPYMTYVDIFIRITNFFILNNARKVGIKNQGKFDTNGIIKFHSPKKQVDSAINLLLEYELIITTRLHGCILAILLNKPCILLNNSYGKNVNFYNTWLKDNFINIDYAENIEDIKKIIKLKFDQHYDM